jgi:hypothetical protein
VQASETGGSKFEPLERLGDAAKSGSTEPAAFLDILSLAHSVVVETKPDAPEGELRNSKADSGDQQFRLGGLLQLLLFARNAS